MDGIATGFAIIAVMIFIPPPATTPAVSPAHHHESRTDEIHAHGVIYYDAPISSVPNILR